MSKTDAVWNMNKKPPTEAELMQAKLDLLQQQDNLQMKSMVELITLLKDLHKSIQKGAQELEAAKSVVREYPLSVSKHIQACLREVEASAERSKQAAEQARNWYGKACEELLEVNKSLKIFALSFGGCFGATLAILVWKTWFTR